jgi:hypothetical protein
LQGLPYARLLQGLKEAVVEGHAYSLGEIYFVY